MPTIWLPQSARDIATTTPVWVRIGPPSAERNCIGIGWSCPEDGHSTTNPMATATAANDRTPMTTHRAA